MKTSQLNLEQAFHILDINLNNINILNINYKYLKRQYYKLSLKTHPDKQGGDINKFQQLNEAYNYILDTLELTDNIIIDTNNDTNNDTNKYADTHNNYVNKYAKDYYNMIVNMLQSYLYVNIPDNLTNIICKITTGYNISSNIFNNLDKYSIINVYNTLYKYKDFIGVNNTLLANIKTIIEDKYKNDKIIIIEPSFKDVWDHNIYKLYIDDNLYLVPLWHHEVYFDCADTDGDIIVLIHPCLPDNVIITENNTIIYKVSIKGEMLINMLNNNEQVYYLNIFDRTLELYIDKLYIKKEQEYIYNNAGIASINDNTCCSINDRADIIIKIEII